MECTTILTPLEQPLTAIAILGGAAIIFWVLLRN